MARINSYRKLKKTALATKMLVVTIDRMAHKVSFGGNNRWRQIRKADQRNRTQQVTINPFDISGNPHLGTIHGETSHETD